MATSSTSLLSPHSKAASTHHATADGAGGEGPSPFMSLLSSFNRGAAVLDIGVAVFLCVVASRSVSLNNFEAVILGVLEFIVGLAIGVGALIRFPLIDKEVHIVYTYAGRGCIYLFFGTLGLSNKDTVRLACSGITIGSGLLYILIGLCGRQSPAPCIDCGGYEGRPPPPTAGVHAAAAPVTGGRPNPWTTPGNRAMEGSAAVVPHAGKPNPFRREEEGGAEGMAAP